MMPPGASFSPRGQKALLCLVGLKLLANRPGETIATLCKSVFSTDKPPCSHLTHPNPRSALASRGPAHQAFRSWCSAKSAKSRTIAKGYG